MLLSPNWLRHRTFYAVIAGSSPVESTNFPPNPQGGTGREELRQTTANVRGTLKVPRTYYF